MFLKPSHKVNIQKLKDNFEIIRSEYLSLDPQDFYDYTSLKSGIENLINKPENKGEFWQVYPLMYQMEPWPNIKSPTVDVLLDLGVTPLLATFSKLAPHSEIPPHEDHDQAVVGDSSDKVIKYHMVIDADTSGGSAIGVGNETRIMNNGDLNVFDESMTHWVYNKSDLYRGVLIISFLEKDLL